MIVTVDMILGKEKAKRVEQINIQVDELGGEIQANLLTKGEYLDIFTEKTDDRDSLIVYNCCPIFRNPKILEKFKCEDNPYAVITEILSDGAIMRIAQIILNESGFGLVSGVRKAVEETKN